MLHKERRKTMNDKSSYILALHGCDDSTYMQVELTADEANLIAKIAALSEEKSEYRCMPVMALKKGTITEDGRLNAPMLPNF